MIFLILGPLLPTENTWNFPTTSYEKSQNWTMETRCGTPGSPSQRGDKNCPNIILINTDDMSWGDLSLNNPSKLIPTPNIDRLVSKGINFRDAHSCSARCAPSR